MNITVKNILLLFFFSCILFSQQKSDFQSNFPEPKFDYITMEDGLAENAIRCIIQDRFGYLWFGTKNGLVRYDGYDMTIYSYNINEPKSINHRSIKALLEDKSGTLWIGTEVGLNRFERKTETFQSYLDSTWISIIHEDSFGNFWIGTDDGLILFDRSTGKFQKFNSEKLKSGFIYCILEDTETGSLNIGTNDGLFSFDIKSKSFKSFFTNSDNPATYSIYNSKNGIKWIGNEKGIIGYDPRTYQKVFSLNTNKSVRLIIEDDDGFIWCYAGSQFYASTGNELIIIDPQSGNYTRMPSEIVMSMYKDRSGIIWIGTGWANLKKWDKHKWKFKSIKHEPGNRNSLSSNHVRTIFADTANILWIGTYKGLDKFERTKGIFTHFNINQDEVTAIHKDNTGIIWLGTNESGLVRFDPVQKTFQYYVNNPNDITSLSSNGIPVIYNDSYGELWVGTWYAGVNRLNKTTGKFRRYREGKNGGLADDQVFTIQEDKSRNLWITSSWGGLNKYDRENDSFSSPETFRREFQNTPIIDIYEDSKKNFWVGTYYSGLHLFDKEKNLSLKNFSENEGMPNNCTVGIFEDNERNLWMKTFKGVVMLNPETGFIRTYYTADGLPSDLTGFFYPHRGPTGEIFIGGFDGLIYFHPDSIKDDPTPPEVLISNLSLFNRPEETLDYDGFISEIKEMKLPYNHNDLRFDFAALHFGEPARNKYKYTLEGFDDDWVDAGTQRNATYTNLSPGEYTLRVIACNRDGIWNEEGASLKLIITPPFWATWWAYSFYVIIFGSILYGIRRYEMNRVNLKNRVKLDQVKLKEKEETDKMKSRFFANISHEFRTPLTLILGPIQKWKEKTISENSPAFQGGDTETHNNKQGLQSLPTELQKDLTMAERNARHLLSLVNQLLDLSKLEAGKLNLQASKGNIVSFAKGVTMSFESLAERKGIDLKFTSEKDEIELYFDRDKLAKILANLLSNAFKFTLEGGEIVVSIACHTELGSESTIAKKMLKQVQHDKTITISVKDTGIGISEEELPKLFDRFYQVDSSHTREHEGTGIGLALTKELVELHHGKIEVKSEVHIGSEFIVELPIGKEHLNDDEIVEVTESYPDVILSPEGTKNLIADVSETTTDSSSKTLQDDNEEEKDKTIILVVEDNADVRAYIKDSLGDSFQVEEAANGELGVEKAKEIIPDLIISDIMMPKMDGNELTRRIKNDERTSHIPVILLTAKSEQESKLEGLETGADDYLTKPFDTKELQVRIRNLIIIRKKLQEKYSSGNFIWKQDKKKLGILDEKFLIKVNEITESHISEEAFSIEEFNTEIGMSKTQIYRKLKALTGKSPSRYIRSIRLSKARIMIKEKTGNISEVAYSVGFSSPQYFNKCFKEEFGCTPGELVN